MLGSKIALVIGNDNYKDNKLECCINDATQISELLSKNYDESSNFDVQLVTDAGNKELLMERIEQLFSKTTDCALFYFSGHGIIKNGKGYILTTENEQIAMSKIFKMATNSKCKHRVIITDCCYSGTLGDLTNTDVAPLKNGMTILTSCQKNEQSDENEDHGIFSELLIEGLNGGASDLLGNITPGSLYAFVDRSLGPWDQRPIFKTNVSEFIPLRIAKAPIDKKVLRSIPKLFKKPDFELKMNPSFEPTNVENSSIVPIPPYANSENTIIFKQLQQLESVGLVKPVGEEHMYYAAMNSKTCKLTPLGKHYYNLVKGKRF